MVISFTLENVRNHLLEKGVVYTLRSKDRKTGKDWANSGRGTKKIADVVITELPMQYLGPFVEHSGFERPALWARAYCDLNHDPYMHKAHLFKVELMRRLR